MLKKNINLEYNNLIKKENHSKNSIKIFGFWIYLMSDFIIFAALLSVCSVLRNGIFNVPEKIQIFNYNKILLETCVLFISSIICDQSIFYFKKNKTKHFKYYLFITLVLGLFFIIIESQELYHMICKNLGPKKNAFLSSLFTLLITHCIHLFIGIIWIILIFIKIFFFKKEIFNKTELKCLNLFWHFLDIIWIFIYSIVYMIGVN